LPAISECPEQHFIDGREPSRTRACPPTPGLMVLRCLVSVSQHHQVMTLLAGEDHRNRQTVRAHGEKGLRAQLATGTPEPVA
jgi:hypothetical protein